MSNDNGTLIFVFVDCFSMANLSVFQALASLVFNAS